MITEVCLSEDLSKRVMVGEQLHPVVGGMCTTIGYVLNGLNRILILCDQIDSMYDDVKAIRSSLENVSSAPVEQIDRFAVAKMFDQFDRINNAVAIIRSFN